MKIEGAWTGVLFQLVRTLIKRIDIQAKSIKNWRPTILAFSTKELNNHPIANLLDWIGSQSSITKIYFLRKGDVNRDSEENKEHQRKLSNYVKNNGLEIFPRSVLTGDYQKTMESLIQAETLGHLPLNTVLVDYDHKIKVNELAETIKKLDKNLIVMRNQAGFSNFKRIDVWWSSENNGNFMILLAYLISHSKRWLENGATIKVFHVVKDIKSEKSGIRTVEKMIEESRIENIELEIIEQGTKQINEIINETSKDADLAMIGLTNLNLKDSKKVSKTIEGLTKDIKVSLIVSANDKIDFRVN
jgi:rRNA maturation endonuclease Nob1